MKNDLTLVKIEKEYIEYLRSFDKRVPYNSNLKENRPFVGVLFTVNELKYFAPLSSPKTKHLYMPNNFDFFKIKHGELGAVNFNNMIPVKEEYKVININAIRDKKYKMLLSSQIYYLNRSKKSFTNRAERLYNMFMKDILSSKIKNRCCDFKLLEEKSKLYKETLVKN